MPAETTATKCASAARRLLQREGAEAVTMRRVAKTAGFTPMAIYRHYPDRASLLNALADEGFADLGARLAAVKASGSAAARLLKMADAYLDHALEKPRLFELMFLQPRDGARTYPQDFTAGRSPTATFLAGVVRWGIETGQLRDDDPWEIVFDMGALSHGLIKLYLGGRIELSATQFRAQYRRAFRRYVRGIAR
jgi:AcrR family transcriptional regulator